MGGEVIVSRPRAMRHRNRGAPVPAGPRALASGPWWNRSPVCAWAAEMREVHHRLRAALEVPAEELEDGAPRLEPVAPRLRQDHSMIAHVLAGLDDVLRRGGTPEQVRGHLDGIGAVMESRSRVEERGLLDLLDALEPHGLDPTQVSGPVAR